MSLTLSGSSGFTVGTPASATVTIYPADLSYGTGLKGSYYTGSSSTYRTTSLGNNNLGGVAAVYSYTQNSCEGRLNSAAGGTEWCGGRKVRHLQINHGGCSPICSNGPKYDAEF